MSRDAEIDALAVRLLQYADSPLLQRHPEVQIDLREAADVAGDHAAALRAACAATTKTSF
jgi:hypothetical protein